MSERTFHPNGVEVRKRRMRRGLTQSNLAGLAGLGLRAIRNIEAGNPVFPQNLAAVAKVLDANLQDLLASEELPRLPNSVKLPRRVEFIGRHNELEAVLTSFRHKRSWLTTIEGIAGIGKTSLAIEAAYQAVNEEIFDAIIFITAQYHDLTMNDIINAIESSLGKKDSTEFSHKRQSIQKLLETTKTLIIIDNFDTIKRDRTTIYKFLSDLPEPSKAVITSRRLEKIEATHISLSQMLKQDGFRFLEHQWHRLNPVGRSRPNFELIWGSTGGNPHFMKLALGQLQRGWSMERVGNFLDNARGEPFSVYEHLWSEMDDDSRLVLLAVTRFAAPASWVSILETVGIADQRLESAMEQLVEMCLIEVSNEILDEDFRYSFHPLTKNFANSKLNEYPSVKEELAKRFVSYFLGFAGQYGGRSWRNYQMFEREQKNIFAAMEFLSESEDWQSLVEISSHIRHFIIRQDSSSLMPTNRLNEYFAQALYLCEKGASAAVKARNSREECKFLLEIGNIQIIRGDLNAARDHLDDCLRKSQEIGYIKREVMALRRLGHIEAREGHYEAARARYQKSRALAKSIEDAIGIGRALRALGDLSFEEGNTPEARRLYKQSLEIARNEVDPIGAPRVARRIASILHREGKFDEAALQFGQVVELYVAKHDINGACYSLYALGVTQKDRSRWEAAVCCWLGTIKALGFIHPDLWPLTLARFEAGGMLEEQESGQSLEVYVPPVDKILSLCLAALEKVKRSQGVSTFDARARVILDTWKNEAVHFWGDFVRQVVADCTLH